MCEFGCFCLFVKFLIIKERSTSFLGIPREFMGPLLQVMFWWAYWKLSNIPYPTFWINYGDFDICLLCDGVCAKLIRMLNCWMKELFEFFQLCIMCWVKMLSMSWLVGLCQRNTMVMTCWSSRQWGWRALILGNP